MFSSRGVQRRRDDGAVIHHLLPSFQYFRILSTLLGYNPWLLAPALIQPHRICRILANWRIEYRPSVERLILLREERSDDEKLIALARLIAQSCRIRVGEICNRTSPWEIGCLSYLAWDGSPHAHGHGKTRNRDGLDRSASTADWLAALEG